MILNLGRRVRDTLKHFLPLFVEKENIGPFLVLSSRLHPLATLTSLTGGFLQKLKPTVSDVLIGILDYT